MKTNKNEIIKPVVIGVGIGALALLLTSGKSKSSTPVVTQGSTGGSTSGTSGTTTQTIDVNKILAKGSTGIEVKELQKMMSITADGIFGTQTETRLFSLKGVKSTSLSKYKTLPNVNQNIYPNGTKIMANISFSNPTSLYEAVKKADGTYESNYKVATTVDYGEEIGTVKGANSIGSWYLVYRESWFSGNYYFVKATDVKKF